MQLRNRVALITGAAQGIGAAVARSFAAEGADVAVVDLAADRADTVAAELRALGHDAIGIGCNVAKRADVDAAVAAAHARFGRIDILVNNAGIIRPAMLHKMTAAQWDEVLAVHLTGSFNCLQAVAPGMMERHYGRIVNVTSAAGVQGTIGQINYSAAKAGILGLTMSAAKELAKHGITVNAIAPGAATPMTETIRTDERFRERYLDRIPLGRWAEPAEIAPVFVFFASDASAYVTGQVLAADGGMTIR
jgi:3-oxoacyl-[acyl-carrier protein] reductase